MADLKLNSYNVEQNSFERFESQYDSSTIPPLPYSLQDEFSGIIKNFMVHLNFAL